MKSAKKMFIISGIYLAIIIVGTSCKKFAVLNTNPNQVTPEQASPDYLMAGVLTQTATWYGNLGSGVISGAMQQTYQDAWGTTFHLFYF